MNKGLLKFRNELFGEIRFVQLEGKPHAIANDVLKALGYSEGGWRTTLSRKCKHVTKCNGLKVNGSTLNLIPEGDIYRLIVGSTLPEAEKFERWIFDEVLPQIRMTGGYIPVTENDDEKTILARALKIADRTIKEKDAIIDSKNKVISGIPELIPLGTVKQYQGATIDKKLRKLGYVDYDEDMNIIGWDTKYLYCTRKQIKCKRDTLAELLDRLTHQKKRGEE